MSADTRYVARAAQTHLFPGAVLAVEGLRVSARRPPPPADLDLVFADGSETVAELLAGDRPTDLLLAVQAYITAAGTAIPAKLWQVRSWDVPASGPVRLSLGGVLHLQEGPHRAGTLQDAAADLRGADSRRHGGSPDALRTVWFP